MRGNIRTLLFVSLIANYSCTDNNRSESPSEVSIIGGQDATKPYPFFVNLAETLSDGRAEAICAGTHIAPGFIVTAAHCVDGFEEWSEMGLSFEESVKVVFNLTNSDDLGSNDKGLIRAKVIATLVHPRYFLEDLHSPDIALIQYDLSPFANAVLPEIAKLPTSEKAADSVPSATVIGFGMTDVSKDLWATHLQEAVVKEVDPEVCSQIDNPIYEGLPDSFVCYGDFEHGKVDACFGDSGGPLFYYNETGDAVVIGITSFGPENDCGVAGEPGVYTSIAYFNDWIEESLADAAIWN